MEASISESVSKVRYMGGGLLITVGGAHFYDLERYLLQVLSDGPMTRSEMKQKTSIPRSTLYDTLKRLIRRGDVTRFKKPHGIGRPNVFYILRKQVSLYNHNNNYIFY